MTVVTPRRVARHSALFGRRDVFAGAMQDEEAPFFPRGAVAFFAAMIVFYAALWFLIFSIMVGRG